MKAHFNSKVEAAIQRSLQVEAQLAELQTKDTPTGVLEDADDDTTVAMMRTKYKVSELINCKIVTYMLCQLFH